MIGSANRGDGGSERDIEGVVKMRMANSDMNEHVEEQCIVNH